MPKVPFGAGFMFIDHATALSEAPVVPECVHVFQVPEGDYTPSEPMLAAEITPDGYSSLNGTYGWAARFMLPFAVLRPLTLTAIHARLKTDDQKGNVVCVLIPEVADYDNYYPQTLDDPTIKAVKVLPAASILNGELTEFKFDDPVVLDAGQYVVMWYDADFIGVSGDHLEETGVDTVGHYGPSQYSFLTVLTEDESQHPVMVLGGKQWDADQAGYDNVIDLPIGHFCVDAFDSGTEVLYQVNEGTGDPVGSGLGLIAEYYVMYAPVRVQSLGLKASGTGVEQNVILKLVRYDAESGTETPVCYFEQVIPASVYPTGSAFFYVDLPSPLVLWQGRYVLQVHSEAGIGGSYLTLTDDREITGNAPPDMFMPEAGVFNLEGQLLPKVLPSIEFKYPKETVLDNMLLVPPAVSTPSLVPLQFLEGDEFVRVVHEWEVLSDFFVEAIKIEVNRTGPFLGNLKAVLRSDRRTEGVTSESGIDSIMTASSLEISTNGTTIITLIPEFSHTASAGDRLTLILQDASVDVLPVEGYDACYTLTQNGGDPLGAALTIPVYQTGSEYFASQDGYALLDPAFSPPATNLTGLYPLLKPFGARTVTHAPATPQDVLDGKASAEGQYIISAQNSFCTPKVTLLTSPETISVNCQRGIQPGMMPSNPVSGPPVGEVALRARIVTAVSMRLDLSLLKVAVTNAGGSPFTLSYDVHVVPGDVSVESMALYGWNDGFVTTLTQTVEPGQGGFQLSFPSGDTLDEVMPFVPEDCTLFLRCASPHIDARHHTLTVDSQGVPRTLLLSTPEGLTGYGLPDAETVIPHLEFALCYHTPPSIT